MAPKRLPRCVTLHRPFRSTGGILALSTSRIKAKLHAHALSADAHHVSAGLLLKLDDRGLAYLAADRSMQAARTSEDPITIGASARIVTHTLMNGRHLQAAIATASAYAQRLDHDITAHNPARSPPPSTASAAPRTSCSPRRTAQRSASASTATSAGRRSARSIPGCTASTSP
jgi:hypothetical protein